MRWPFAPAQVVVAWRSGPLTVDETLRLLRRAAEAVAHARGIIHHDLKPSNLFLVDGEVDGLKLLDFGIARRVDAVTTLTRTGAILGTPTLARSQ